MSARWPSIVDGGFRGGVIPKKWPENIDIKGNKFGVGVRTNIFRNITLIFRFRVLFW